MTATPSRTAAAATLAPLAFEWRAGIAAPHGAFHRADGVQVYWHDNGEESGWMIVEADGNAAYWLGHDDVIPAEFAPIVAALS